MHNFKKGKRISEGAFGTVYEAEVISMPEGKNFPKQVAIKQVYSSSQNLQRQLSILASLPKNRHIVEVYTTFTHEFQTYIVMDKGECDLSSWIQKAQYPICQNMLKNIAHQLLLGVHSIHSSGIVHRDLKPSNLVVMKDGSLAICDFGSATPCFKEQEYEIEGFTRWYKCPQMLYGSRRYEYQADIWSVGCILMEIATGCPLFGGKSEIEQLSMIAKFLGDPSPENWPSVSSMPDYNKINFKAIKPLTPEEIAIQWSVSPKFACFLLKMLKYQNRLASQQLLKDEYFQNMKIQQSLGSNIDVLMIRGKQLSEDAKKAKII